jgi:hypothetical protein
MRSSAFATRCGLSSEGKSLMGSVSLHDEMMWKRAHGLRIRLGRGTDGRSLEARREDEIGGLHEMGDRPDLRGRSEGGLI